MTIQYSIARTISGQTGTVVKLFAVNGVDTVLYTADSVTERTNAKGQYLVTWDEASVIPAGDYTQIMFSSGGLPLSIGDRTFSGVDGETATDRAAELNATTQSQIDAMTRGLIAGVVGSSSSTTVVNVTSTESGLAVTDQLKGRVIIFNKDTTTAALRGQGAPIDTNDTTSITVASGDAFTTAPASGDTFTIY